jgi:hypothetical protein
MDQRQVVRMIAAGRVVLGVVATTAPRRTAALAFGAERSRGALTMATRMLGARDLVLGLGTLRALDRNADPAGWATAGAVADAIDAVAALSVIRTVPASKVAASFLAAAAAAILGTRAAPHLR